MRMEPSPISLSLSNSPLPYSLNSKTTSGKSVPEVVVSVEEEFANLLYPENKKKNEKEQKD